MDSYTKYWKGYTDFKGRASRQDFWDPTLVNLAISAGLMISVACALTDITSSSVRDFAVLCLFAGLLVGWKLVRLVPDAALIVRRTQDAGLTGWIGVVLYIGSFIPYVDLVAGVLLVIIGCLATDSANLSAFAWQSDSQEAASAEKTTHSDAQLNAADIASDSDTKRYEQLSLDLDFDDADQADVAQQADAVQLDFNLHGQTVAVIVGDNAREAAITKIIAAHHGHPQIVDGFKASHRSDFYAQAISDADIVVTVQNYTNHEVTSAVMTAIAQSGNTKKTAIAHTNSPLMIERAIYRANAGMPAYESAGAKVNYPVKRS